jgi:hypothetical protein
MSAQGFLDACGFIASSAGTGNLVVASAIQGYQTPAAAGAQSIAYSYRCESADKSQWEEGFGVYNTTTSTLARTTITANSSGNTSAVNFLAAPNVFITALSTDLQNAALLASGTLPGARIAPLIQGYIFNLTLSTAGSSSTFGVASGCATDSGAADVMTLSASISKTTGAWTSGSGNGALDTGTIAANSWYWVFLIKNPTSGSVDVLITKSVAATSPVPTLPSGFTISRYIGSMLTNASSQWTAFSQFEDTFYWATAVQDVASTSPTSNVDVTQTLTIPLGVRVKPLVRFNVQANTNAADVQLRSPDLMSAESAPSADGSGPVADAGSTVSGGTIVRIAGSSLGVLHSNTSGQIVYRPNYPSGAGAGVFLRTYGWVDRRGAGVVSSGGAPAIGPQMKAAVFFKVSSGTITIVNSFNVSSVTSVAAGFQINFTTPFGDANYFVSQLMDAAATVNAWPQLNNTGANKTASSCVCSFVTVSGGSLSGVSNPPGAYLMFYE